MRRSLTMMTLLLAVAVALSAAPRAKVRGPQTKESPYQFDLRGFARQEWTTRQYFDVPDDNRWQFRMQPQIAVGRGWITAGIGGDVTHGSADNVADVSAELGTYAENYKTRGLWLNLAYLRLRPLSWLRLEGGRFEMPVPLTEMLWDADIKPQGGAITFELTPKGEVSRLALTALAARGSHVFDDNKTNMLLLSATAEVKGGGQSQLALVGSLLEYTDYNDANGLDSRLFRQNSRGIGGLSPRFRVVDLQARLRSQSNSPTQFFVDYCFNTKADERNHGLWTGLTVGDLAQSVARFEYVYARIDRDATLGAYNTDDFPWSTDWEGHRAEIGMGLGRTSSIHVIGQLQRPREATELDGSRPWVRRIRVELRTHTFY